MAICEGGGEEEEERKIAETCVRNCLRLDRCGFPQRIIIIRGIPAHGRDYLMKELLGGGGGGRWKRGVVVRIRLSQSHNTHLLILLPELRVYFYDD